MNGKKPILLFLALILPVLIFVFLKFFGKNEFEVPLIYEKGVVDSPSKCALEYSTPYILPDSVVSKLGASGSVVVLDFSERPSDQMQVVRDEFADDKVVINSASSVKFAQHDFIRDCVMLLRSPNSIVLIDSKKQIRGYYENSREEIDRLILELKILLKKY